MDIFLLNIDSIAVKNRSNCKRKKIFYQECLKGWLEKRKGTKKKKRRGKEIIK